MIRADLPKYMVPKELAAGQQSWYWSPNARLLPKDGKFRRRPLGSELGLAMTASKLINLNFEFWREFGYTCPAADVIVAAAFDSLKRDKAIPEDSLLRMAAVLSAERLTRGGIGLEKGLGLFDRKQLAF